MHTGHNNIYLYGVNDGWSDALAARHIVAQLNAKISATVTAISNARLHYIDPNTNGSPFVGHTVCADKGESFFNNVDQALPTHPAYVFHPNSLGQEGYATIMGTAINAG